MSQNKDQRPDAATRAANSRLADRLINEPAKRSETLKLVTARKLA